MNRLDRRAALGSDFDTTWNRNDIRADGAAVIAIVQFGANGNRIPETVIQSQRYTTVVVIGKLRLPEVNAVGHSEPAFIRLVDFETVDMNVGFEWSKLY